MPFEADLARIEAILAELEADTLELDRALRLFEEGVARLRDAAAALDAAEGRIRLLVESADGSLSLSDLAG